ncbi:PREDICTED: uncharacterized protein LOC109231553 [Nicotiana attenuata]|uniref:uncharacterized protein LOC109231553 n=1 Tax=Nicotiana attenuata TaxID=49451 RepID=UPI000904C3F4|nr:PREDICTED: uncharacterized protein LOC109231553 [Nicotiana attenuata]
MSTVNCLIVVVVKKQWSLFQLDVNNAFLHGDLDAEVYMKIPLGLSVSSVFGSTFAPLACKVQKSLYGLRQVSKQWYAKLSQALCTRGHTHSINNYSLFVKGMTVNLVILAIYADDIILTGDDIHEIAALKLFLDAEFKIKDLGPLHYFLGIEISYFPGSGDLLPNAADFRSLIGKLLFLTHTRPDLCFSVQHLSQFNQSPRVAHMTAALHVLRYLKGTVDLGLFYSSVSDFSLTAYSDSDRTACADTRKSVTGFCIFLGDSLIGLKSKKQPIVSLSSAEAEYRALIKVVAELTWLTRLLTDICVPASLPVFVFCDSKAAIHIAKNPVFHEHTKHIEVDFHFIWIKLLEGLISLSHISTAKQPADILTKP